MQTPQTDISTAEEASGCQSDKSAELSLIELRDQIEELKKLMLESRNLSLLIAKSFLTVEHAALYSDLSVETIRQLYKAGKLTALRPVRGRIVIERKELDAYIRSCDKQPRTGRGFHSRS